MTSDADSPERIEREIEHDRNALRQTLNDLQGELSLDGLTRRVTDQLRDHGGEWANSAAQAARANPLALALTGVGLAWLIFGRGYDPTHQRGSLSLSRRGDDAWWRPSSASSTGSQSASHGSSTNTGGASARHEGSHGQPSVTETISSKASDLGSRMSGTGSSIGEGLRRTAHDWRDSIGDRAGSLQDRLSHGTEDLGDEARRRVADARRRALDAQDAAARNLRQGRRAIEDSFNTEPLAFGAAAFAVGAGLACLLPRTRQEDELVGSYSDQLFAEAEAIFKEEKAKVQKAVAAGVEEAKSAAADVAAAAKDELAGRNSDSASGQPEPARSVPSGSTGSGSI